MMHPLCTTRLLVLNCSPVLVETISVDLWWSTWRCNFASWSTTSTDWLPYSFLDQVHQNLFFLTPHLSILLPGTIVINNFSFLDIHCLILSSFRHQHIFLLANGISFHVSSTTFLSSLVKNCWNSTASVNSFLLSPVRPMRWIHMS